MRLKSIFLSHISKIYPFNKFISKSYKAAELTFTCLESYFRTETLMILFPRNVFVVIYIYICLQSLQKLILFFHHFACYIINELFLNVIPVY